MYYKLYRRRQQIFLLLAVVFIIFIFTLKSNSKTDGKKPLEAIVVRKKGERVNMQNYVPPPPCDGCPGENGQGVSLTVSFRIF